MSKLMRITVAAAALLSLMTVMSAEANAVTWHNTGDTSFTATGGATTFSTTGVNLTCTSWDETGTSPSGSFVGATYPMNTGVSVGTGCSLSGLPTSVTCSFTDTATTVTSGVVSGQSDENCNVLQFGSEICKIHAGGQTWHYTNPVPPMIFGRKTRTHTTQHRTTNGAGGTCPLAPGEPTTVTHTTRIWILGAGGPSSHLGPVITRTA